MYRCGLSLDFLLSIRYNWLPSDLKKADPAIHFASTVVPLGIAVLG
jgi:hypothetical protein